MATNETRRAVGDAAAHQLANTTKTAPQLSAITPRWLVQLLSWVPVESGTYRVNKVKNEGEIEVVCGSRDERKLPETFVDYEEKPREYTLSAISTIVDVHTRVSDLYSHPHIDRLAAEGVRFTQAYAGAPVCAPSRSVLMTGLHTGHTRVRDNFALAGGKVGFKGKEEIRRASLTNADHTVAEFLAQDGYDTALLGKWHLDGYDPAAIPTRHGFKTFKGWLTQTGSTQGYYPAQRYHNTDLVDVPENAGGKQGRYGTTIVTEDAVDYIAHHKDKPFFLYVAYDAPHSPYLAPDFGSYANEHWDDDEKTYASMIEHLDNGVGAILDAVKSSGIDQDTIVFFASDNGPRSEPTPQQTKVVNFFDSNGILHGYKRDVYEGGIRDPFIARWPEHIPAGNISDVPVFFADFMPTALDLAGAPTRLGDGINLKPFLLDPRLKGKDRFLYWEFYEPVFEQSVRWGKWKAVRHGRKGPLELYNMDQDPSETINVSEQHPETVDRIERYIKETHKPSAEYPDPV